jgi:hypothetical protein
MTRFTSTAIGIRRSGTSRFVGVAVVLSIASLAAIAMSERQPSTADATSKYIAQLDLGRFERNGTRYTDPDMSPFRILPELSEHDQVFHYDFARLESVERRLSGVIRREALRAIFAEATRGAATNRDRHLAILRFLHRASFHNLIQPMYRDGTTVYDPLVLLELGEMRCGHVNRVAVDLFQANGYRGRLVQAAFHILAEIWYDGGWHYFDGDIFGNGECVVMDNGKIPSMNELGQCLDRLDALTSFWEPNYKNEITGPTPYPSWYYFGERAYHSSKTVPSHIEKVATPELEGNSRYYGWEFELTTPDPERHLRSDIEERFTPGAPRIVAMNCSSDREQRQITLRWKCDPAAVSYRVFVARTSRGWEYSGSSLPAELCKWKSGPGNWNPEMYDARFHLPPSDLLLLETKDTHVTFDVPHQSPAFISVMAFDEYGRSIGRHLYPLSEELCLP